MSSPFVLPDGWTIKSWDADAADGSSPEIVPADGVQVEGLLEITEQDDHTLTLTWPTGSEGTATVTGVQPDLAQAPEGQDLTVHFGGDPVPCNLQLTLVADPKTLTCKLISPPPARVHGKEEPDSGGGTFTAAANG